VDVKIKYELPNYPDTAPIISAVEETEAVLNTVKLLTEIYSGTTIQKKIEAENLVEELLREIKKFQKMLQKWVEASLEEKTELRNWIMGHLDASSNFTAFKRWIIRDNEVLMAEFGIHLD
jgi:hypothetical protein